MTDKMLIMVPTYNDIEALDRLLKSAAIHKTKVVVMDGRFIDFPQINGSDLSTDGTKELTEKTCNYYLPLEPCLEQDKYTAGLKFGYSKGYKYVIWLASDEWIEGNVDASIEQVESHNITTPMIIKTPYVEHNPDRLGKYNWKTQARIHVNYKDMSYRNVHWHAYNGDTRITATGLIRGITIHHDDRIRPKERDDMMGIYEKFLMEKEKKWL